MKTAQERALLDEAESLGLIVRFHHVRPEEGAYNSATGHKDTRPKAKGGKTVCLILRPTAPVPPETEGSHTLEAEGVARCSPRETYNKGIGRAISLGRAMQMLRSEYALQ
jgi:hypothetical protein